MYRATAFALALTIGCSSNYLPQARGHVAVTMRDGAVAYVRDGRIYPHGFLGHGLGDAVAGNPAAMAAASEYSSRMGTGLIGALVGTVSMTVGTTWLMVDAGRESTTSGSTKDVTVPAAMMLGGLVVMCLGAGYLASAEPYRWDAINLFNDGGDAAPPAPILTPPGAPAPGYGGPSARASLHMGD